MPNDLSLDQRLRDSEGMDLMDVWLKSQALSLRGNMQVDTETEIHIPLWLRSCKECKGSKPEDKELCGKCQERAWDEEAQWRGEEQDRKRFEHSTSI